MDDATLDRIEELTSAAYTRGSAADVTALRDVLAIERTPMSAREKAVTGGAYLVLYKHSQEFTWLDTALDLLSAAYDEEPTPTRASNLAAALLERRSWPWDEYKQQHAALETALRLLRTTLTGTPPGHTSWTSRTTVLLGALLDAIESGHDQLLDEALDTGERLHSAVAPGTDGWQEAANLYGSALRLAADRDHPRGNLDMACELLHGAVEGTPRDHLDWPARASNLASVLMEAADASGRHPLGPDAPSEYAREALSALDPAEPGWPLAANNLINALLAQHVATGDEPPLSEAVSLLPMLLERVPPGHWLRSIAASNAGGVLRAAAETGRPDGRANLDRAVALHREALALSDPTTLLYSGRQASLAHALADRYDRHGQSLDDLNEALDLGTAAIDRGGSPPHERGAFLSNLGNLVHERYLRTGRIADLQYAAELYEGALSLVAPTHPLSAAFLNNAATVLNARYNRLGDPHDLVAAADALARSIDFGAPPRDRSARLVNLSMTLLDVYQATGEEHDLDRAQNAARAALESTDERSKDLAEANLIDVLRRRQQDFSDQSVDEELSRRVTALARRPARSPGANLRTALSAPPGRRASRLIDVAQQAMTTRPAVALAAARQLALDGLADAVAGRHSESAEVAAHLARPALDQLAAQRTPRESIAWAKEAQGLGGALAQTHLLHGDSTTAVAEHDAWSARVLTEELRATSPSDTTTVTVWTTPFGGGAVIRQAGQSGNDIVLPQFTTARTSTWARRLQNAARLGNASLAAAFDTVVDRLSDAVTRPISTFLEPGEPLVWCCVGPAATLPWAACRDAGGSPLITSHTLRLSPTTELAAWASEKARATSRRDPQPRWSLADPSPTAWPRLPGARLEGIAFADGPKRLTGEEASVIAARHALGEADVLHIACHARTNTPDPLANHLLLANDEPWFADDIRQESAAARLVVLSACDTASVGEVHADEGLGLPAAFHLAGVPGVIATLWPVPDTRTSSIMSDLAASLRDGESPETALRSAIARGSEGDRVTVLAAAFVLSGA